MILPPLVFPAVSFLISVVWLFAGFCGARLGQPDEPETDVRSSPETRGRPLPYLRLLDGGAAILRNRG